MGLSKLAEKCQKCPFVTKCDRKRMEAVGYLQYSAPATQGLTEQAAAPIAREIVTRVMYGKTYTMYKDELERELSKALYAGLDICKGLMNGGRFNEL